MADEWLPELVLNDTYGGNWESYLAAIYKVFKKDFVDDKPNFPGKRVALRKHPVEQGKEATFWHFISEGQREEDRTPDFRRCERIAWPRPMIEAFGDAKVRCWCNTRKGKKRILIALDDFSYLTVLDDRKDYVLPLTAYFVEQPHRRKKLRKECEEAQGS